MLRRDDAACEKFFPLRNLARLAENYLSSKGQTTDLKIWYKAFLLRNMMCNEVLILPAQETAAMFGFVEDFALNCMQNR